MNYLGTKLHLRKGVVKCNGPSMNYTFDGSQTMPQDIKDLYDIGLKVKIMSIILR